MKYKKSILSIVLAIALILVVIYSSKSSQIQLTVTTKNIEVDGKKVLVNTVVQPDGTWGYYATVGDEFNVRVKNKLKEPVVLHWHGLLLPNKYDGTELTQKYIQPNGSYDYKFKLKQSGTFWMHSHYGYQEQTYVEAPLIVYPRGYDSNNDIVVMFQDFSFKKPENIMANLKQSMDMHDTQQKSMSMQKDKHLDLNDVQYDAFLTNYHANDKPEIKVVKSGQKYRLRFINGSSSTNFWINLGQLQGTAIAVDGVDIKPYQSNMFQLAIAQRMDIQITIPDSGNFTIYGQVEGEKQQTGIVLTTNPNYKNLAIPNQAQTKSSAFNYNQLEKLHPRDMTINTSDIQKTIDLKLTGDMQSYTWKINDQVWPNVAPIELKYGKTYLFKIQNDTEMSHPIHIHGHYFKVIKIDGKSVKDGAIRDTIYVMPKSSIIIALKADTLGKWFLHCHMLYHMHSGMMTFIETKKD